MRPGRLLTTCIALTVALAACGSPPALDRPRTAAGPTRPTLSFVADAVIPFAGRATGLEFGGLSGLVFDPDAERWIGVSDDRQSPRWFTLDVRFTPAGLAIDVGPAVLAEDASWNREAPPTLDLESVGLLPNGDLLAGSEGDLVAGVRHPHAVVRLTRDGRFVHAVPLPTHYLGDPDGTRPHGLRDNLGFEGMAISPEGTRAWLAAENPLAQDDDKPTIIAGARTRLLELVAEGDTLTARREFVYEIAASGRPVAIGADAVLADQGVVALLWIADDELLSMERAFLRDAASGVSVVRIFHVHMADAEDVSAVPSLRARPHARPVTKTLVLDLADLAPALRPSLARLDNFEAMAWGPPLPDGTRTILIASDDNFSRRQQNAFLLLKYQE